MTHPIFGKRLAIPVLGIPVLNRGDLLRRCLQSIDYPVELTVIVNNGDDAGVRNTLHEMVGGSLRIDSSESRFSPLLYQRNDGSQVLVVTPETNLGVAASWNFIL